MLGMRPFFNRREERMRERERKREEVYACGKFPSCEKEEEESREGERERGEEETKREIEQ